VRTNVGIPGLRAEGAHPGMTAPLEIIESTNGKAARELEPDGLAGFVPIRTCRFPHPREQDFKIRLLED
jgi:hypothetical protein